MKKSKKIISLVMAIVMVLLVPVSVVSAAPKGYGFRYAGVTVYVHGKASGLIDKMGEPNKKSKSKSCAYDYIKKGKDQRRNQDWKQRKNNEKEIWKGTRQFWRVHLQKGKNGNYIYR